MPTKKEQKAAIIAAGRKSLCAFLNAAKKHGTIYYNIQSVSRSGMSRQINLYTIGGRQLIKAWPHIRTEHDHDERWPSFNYSEAMDVVSKDWGFNFDKRALVIGGCGMDMVFALICDLAWKAYGRDGITYANDVRRESI